MAPASPGRRLATTIQANGIAHSAAAAHNNSTSGLICINAERLRTGILPIVE
jgi:hypothetical protein